MEGSCAQAVGSSSGGPAVNASEGKLCAFTGSPILISSGLRIGQPSGPWFVLNATLHLFSAPHAYLLPNRNGHVSARLPLLPGQVNQKTPQQFQSLSKLSKRSKVCTPGPCSHCADARVEPLSVTSC